MLDTNQTTQKPGLKIIDPSKKKKEKNRRKDVEKRGKKKQRHEFVCSNFVLTISLQKWFPALWWCRLATRMIQFEKARGWFIGSWKWGIWKKPPRRGGLGPYRGRIRTPPRPSAAGTGIPGGRGRRWGRCSGCGSAPRTRRSGLWGRPRGGRLRRTRASCPSSSISSGSVSGSLLGRVGSISWSPFEGNWSGWILREGNLRWWWRWRWDWDWGGIY